MAWVTFTVESGPLLMTMSKQNSLSAAADAGGDVSGSSRGRAMPSVSPAANAAAETADTLISTSTTRGDGGVHSPLVTDQNTATGPNSVPTTP